MVPYKTPLTCTRKRFFVGYIHNMSKLSFRAIYATYATLERIIMSTRSIFFLSSFATLAALHFVFITFQVYDRLDWLDIPIHIFAGAVVGLGLLALSDFSVRHLRHLRWHTVSTGLLLFIVLAWEVFGYLYLGSSARPDYLSDTIVDIVAGLGGGIIGLYIGRRLAVI